jgi:FO synthase
VPHRRYYGEEPADIATEAAERYWRTGPARRPGRPAPAWASPVSVDDMERLVREARRLMPEVGIQIPPNLADWWPRLVAAGATDLGGLSANGDHISPSTRSRRPSQVRKRLRADGYALTERSASTRASSTRSGWRRACSTWSRRATGASSRGAGSGRLDGPKGALRPDTVARARDGRALVADELTALFAETRPAVIEDMRQAADELRAELAGDTVTFVVNRNINVSNVCIVGCAFCGFGQGRRSPDAYTHERDDFVARISDASEYGATELCISPASTRLGRWRTTSRGCGWRRDAPDIHLHAYSPMEVAAHVRPLRAPADEVFARLREAGLGSVPGTGGRGAPRRRARADQPEQAARRPLGRDHRGRARAGLRSTVTVMFGHIEEPHELAEHMRVVRALQERTGGFTEFVPLSFIPFQTLLGRTHGIEEISREENLKHTAAFRLALGKTIPSLQASWVKMGLDAATEALRWGVNDLGGTLMEESISRLAGSYHGVKLDPPELIAAATPPGGRRGADDALRDPARVPGRRGRGLTEQQVAVAVLVAAVAVRRRVRAATSSAPPTASSRSRWLAPGSCQPVTRPSTARTPRAGVITSGVQPAVARSRPSGPAADSSARVTVVPTGDHAPPARRVALTRAAVAPGTEKRSGYGRSPRSCELTPVWSTSRATPTPRAARSCSVGA